MAPVTRTMKNQEGGTTAFKGKRVTVVGLARSGIAAARALDDLGALVTVTDKKPHAELTAQLATLGREGIGVAAGGHPENLFLEADLVVVSPGVPKIPQLAMARRHGVKVISELELGWMLSDSPVIGITGTNGKSTVTSLVGRMLEQSGKRVFTAGNIGNALTEKPEFLRGQDWIVVEISSFQLEDIETFRPRIAAILNITMDHLDRYRDMKEYAEAKARIFERQTGDDVLVMNYDDHLVKEMAEGTAARVIPFSRREKVAHGVYVEDGAIVFSGEAICRVDEITIKGVHNLENCMAAIAVALAAGAKKDAVAAVAREFPGLEHRLEFVREKNGVIYINDSKGTNVGAVIRSVEGFTGPVILIAGGSDKGSDFSQLSGPVRKNVTLLVLIGTAADAMAAALRGATEIVHAKTLEEAVLVVSKRARSGEVVLLSPACASFDMFQDFEDRGRQFKEAVMKL